MATPGKPLDEQTRKMIERRLADGHSRRKTAAETGTCKRTVDKYSGKKPDK